MIAQTPYRIIANRFAIGQGSLQRHVTEHIASSVKQSQEAQEEARGLDVVKQLKDINDITRKILNKALKSKDNDVALRAIDRITKQLELQAKLLGDTGGVQIIIEEVQAGYFGGGPYG